MKAHEQILAGFLRELAPKGIETVLDAGSGGTSLTQISSAFPKLTIDCIVYPGDERKIRSLEEKCAGIPYQIIEMDLCKTVPDKTYSLTAAHLLLGEASKFGNIFPDLLRALFSIQTKYLIVIDYLEDPNVDTDRILQAAKDAHFTLASKTVQENEEPQVWEDFTGLHNFGYLFQKEQL